ncbi:helix-hairpin-helix domain-containing protein [Carnobacterium gallinarum]|uniref:helix-hairpin-helix domain-containing protein n=1 Tax=Carnobacterium gallinarum TaxID=2749 RepID=UPI0005597A2C|nr:helix-hairpin-helix domain-containing protein [Carnobacterium gallinarum]
MDHLKQWMKEHQVVVKVVIGGISAMCLIGGVLFWQMAGIKSSSQPVELEALLASEISTSEKKEEISKSSVDNHKEIIMIDLKGAIKKPGVYQGTSEMRLIDMIALAGGFLENANQTPINLALRLEDQMVIYIPIIGEELSIEAISPVQPKEANHSENQKTNEQVNINTADVSELQKLNGIGQKKAETILQHREENGSFQTIEELKNISGIGVKIFEGLKEQITVGQ